MVLIPEELSLLEESESLDESESLSDEESEDEEESEEEEEEEESDDSTSWFWVIIILGAFFRCSLNSSLKEKKFSKYLFSIMGADPKREIHRYVRKSSKANWCEEINGKSRVPRVVTWEKTLEERLKSPEE